MELTGVNERVLMDNLEICRKNGFTFKVNEDALPTKRVKLLTLPISKDWIFGKEDVEELLFMLKVSCLVIYQGFSPTFGPGFLRVMLEGSLWSPLPWYSGESFCPNRSLAWIF